MDSSCPISKFLADCEDLHLFVDDVDKKLKLLDLEVGVLLKRPITQGDGPSDASLQVLQEARSIKKNLNSSISESSEMVKNMGHLLKELMEKVKVSYHETEELEKYMEDYGYETPPPLDPGLFEIFRDNTQSAPASDLSSQEDCKIEDGESPPKSEAQQIDHSQESGDCIEGGDDKVVDTDDDEILDKTEENADIEATETKLKPNSRDRYQFQTSVLNTPVQAFHFSKKTINFQNSYLFQSPSDLTRCEPNSILDSALKPKSTSCKVQLEGSQAVHDSSDQSDEKIPAITTSSQDVNVGSNTTSFQPTSILKPPSEDFEYTVGSSARKFESSTNLTTSSSLPSSTESSKSQPLSSILLGSESKTLQSLMASNQQTSAHGAALPSSTLSTFRGSKASQGMNILTSTLESLRASRSSKDSAPSLPSSAAKTREDNCEGILDDITEKIETKADNKQKHKDEVESTVQIPDNVAAFLSKLTASSKKQKENEDFTAGIKSFPRHSMYPGSLDSFSSSNNSSGSSRLAAVRDLRARPSFVPENNPATAGTAAKADKFSSDNTDKPTTPDNVREFLRSLGNR